MAYVRSFNLNSSAPPPSAFNGDGYRGGGTGVESDFGLRDMFARGAMESIGRGMNMITEEDRERARGDLSGALGGYRDLMTNGMYTGGEMNGILSNRVQQVNNTSKAMQQNFNTQMSQRGLGGNAGAQAAMGMAGQFQAAGQRGEAYAGLQQEQAQSRMKGLDGFAGVSGALSNLAATATRPKDDIAGQYANEYEKWRNVNVGYDGAKWGNKPAQPAFYAG